jgi:hypothetical protein
MRPTPTTLPHKPDDRGIPASPSAVIPLPDLPDAILSIDFCREKLKKKIKLCGNDLHYAKKQMKVLMNNNCEL